MSALLTAAEDLDLKGEWEDELTDTCTINDKVRVESDSGGSTVTLNPITSNVACSIGPVMADEVIAGSKQSIQRGWQVGFPLGTSVSAAQVITSTKGTFQVTGIMPATHEMGVVALAKEY